MKRVVLASIGIVIACGAKQSDTLPPLGQLLLYVETDAPLPAPAGDTLGPNDPPALFDRVRIELFRPNESTPCADCTHEFDLDRAIVTAGRASVGVTTPPGTVGYVARVRLYRAAFQAQGQPRADATIDRYVALPATAAEGITEVTAPVHVDDVAKTIGTLASPSTPKLGPPDPKIAGSWAGAKRVFCNNSPQAGEVCVPSGAFWMGNPLMAQAHELGDAVTLRIVTLAPFFLDATEVTVAAFRSGKVAATRDPMDFHDADNQPNAPIHCTYTPSVENDEDLPVSCLSWQRARAYCQTRGADLPTEAQLEYAAGGLASHLYPWGDDPPTCADAVFSRSIYTVPPDDKCPGAWVEPPGSGVRDRLVLPSGTIVDLAGNLSEYALDRWDAATGGCWPTGVLADPICTTPTKMLGAPDGAHVFKLGSWVSNGEALAAPIREWTRSFSAAQTSGPSGGSLSVFVTGNGFRCARADD